MSQDVYHILKEKLSVRSGELQTITCANGEMSQILFQIKWDRRISFTVHGWNHFGWYYVEKDNQHVSALFHYKKITDSDLGIMQNLIDEVESGKYDSKKTLSDRIHEAVQDRQLTSYMNKTKWAELLDEIGDIPDALIMYKTLFENDAPKFYWTIAGDEQFFHMNMAQIEWLKIADTITESKHQGMLLEPKITEKYIGDRIKDILEEHSINYEYIEAEKSFLIFGYR